uniref:Uncharacterized protein n=1 Tax=Arion vulgaris TaxID=1028688 RepID=A0A0B7AH85_9EUPU
MESKDTMSLTSSPREDNPVMSDAHSLPTSTRIDDVSSLSLLCCEVYCFASSASVRGTTHGASGLTTNGRVLKPSHSASSGVLGCETFSETAGGKESAISLLSGSGASFLLITTKSFSSSSMSVSLRSVFCRFAACSSTSNSTLRFVPEPFSADFGAISAVDSSSFLSSVFEDAATSSVSIGSDTGFSISAELAAVLPLLDDLPGAGGVFGVVSVFWPRPLRSPVDGVAGFSSLFGVCLCRPFGVASAFSACLGSSSSPLSSSIFSSLSSTAAAEALPLPRFPLCGVAAAGALPLALPPLPFTTISSSSSDSSLSISSSTSSSSAALLPRPVLLVFRAPRVEDLPPRPLFPLPLPFALPLGTLSSSSSCSLSDASSSSLSCSCSFFPLPPLDVDLPLAAVLLFVDTSGLDSLAACLPPRLGGVS